MKIPPKKLTLIAITAALYAALTLIFAPISFGNIQARISELLCVLPFFFPCTCWGLFIGCIIANLLSPAGPLDMVFGPIATLLAAFCSAYIGKTQARDSFLGKVLALFMPVLFNGVIVGAVLAATSAGTGSFFKFFLIFGLEVAAGEAAVMYILGYPILSWFPKSSVYSYIKDRFLH